MKTLRLVAASALFLPLALRAWRHTDERALERRWHSLIAYVDPDPPRFDPGTLAELPEPARRFLGAVIRPGTPLRSVAEIAMHGELSLGSKAEPAYRPMRARQLLAAPHGFVWQVRIGKGATSLVGSDAAFPGGSWTRFWLAGLVPVARAGGDADHALSSFGRYMAEAVFWTPAALLPSDLVHWQMPGADTARVTVEHGSFTESFDVTVDAEGLPTRIEFQRWSNANPEKTHRRQPFGGFLSDFREFDGYVVPTTVVAGNHVGTDDYFPFFRATVDSVRYVARADGPRRCPPP